MYGFVYKKLLNKNDLFWKKINNKKKVIKKIFKKNKNGWCLSNKIYVKLYILDWCI